ncbi:MAG: DUF1573 domain-containing protein [Bacteroidaceae bacterium]|nr:DUF1573 domain-containing protein [Bacteroidaceae bacterium]
MSKMMKRLLIILITIVMLAACQKPLQPASVIIIDPVRHYYPVIQGEKMSVTYEIENTSDNPLFIQEVQTSCGCLVPRDELPIVILPHRNGFVTLDYNTIMNNGYVDHYVYCYGNFQDTTAIVMSFDTNVVPASDYFRDYEQLWNEQEKISPTIHTFVNGTSAQKGYYTDTGVNPRQERKEEVQNEIDQMAP